MAELMKPTKEHREAFAEFHREWKRSGETMIPWVIANYSGHYEELLDFLHREEKGTSLKDGWVKNSTYWLVEGGKVIGAVNIRHQLTKKLLEEGGHIGYGIRPSYRGKGYGNRMLTQALGMARRLGIKEALLVCEQQNEASYRMIIGHGGREDEDFIEEDGTVLKRLWIPLT
ncbi:MAG: GNAT family N-acetyltransferase [Bacillus sp. (in: firmicutes)]